MFAANQQRLLDQQDALKQSEDKLNSILNSVEAYIYIKGRDYTYHYANRQVCELFGRSLPEIVGTEDTAFFDEPTLKSMASNSLSEIAAKHCWKRASSCASRRVRKLPINAVNGGMACNLNACVYASPH